MNRSHEVIVFIAFASSLHRLHLGLIYGPALKPKISVNNLVLLVNTKSGLAPRIFFIFPPFLREEGRGVRGERGISIKSEEKRG